MKALTAVVLVAALGCGKKAGDSGAGSAASGSDGSGSGSGSADPMDSWEREKRAVQTADLARLNKPESYGPGAAVAFTPVPETPAKPGPAYLWVKQVGLVAIDGGDAKVIVKAPETNVFELALDAGDRLLLSSGYGQRLDGTTLADLSKDPVAIDDLVVAPDGTVWMHDGTRLAKLEGERWIKQPDYETGEGVVALGIDGAGRPLVVSFGLVSVLDAGVWKPIIDTRTWPAKQNELGHPLWSQAIVAPNGELWLLGCNYLVRLAGGKPAAMVIPDPGIRTGRFVDGVLIAEACDDHATVRVTPGEQPRIQQAEWKTKVKSNFLVNTHAIDARGRVWAANPTEGLAIVSPDGTATTFPPGSLPAISGDVDALVVVGSGPDALPKAMEIATGTITGTVRDKGAPVAKAVVEMCRFPSGRFYDSPCSVQKDRIRGETDDAGVFRIEGPLKTYRVAAKIGEHWYMLIDKDCGGIAPGGECSIGVMDTANEIKPTSRDAPP